MTQTPFLYLFYTCSTALFQALVDMQELDLSNPGPFKHLEVRLQPNEPPNDSLADELASSLGATPGDTLLLVAFYLPDWSLQRPEVCSDLMEAMLLSHLDTFYEFRTRQDGQPPAGFIARHGCVDDSRLLAIHLRWPNSDARCACAIQRRWLARRPLACNLWVLFNLIHLTNSAIHFYASPSANVFRFLPESEYILCVHCEPSFSL